MPSVPLIYLCSLALVARLPSRESKRLYQRINYSLQFGYSPHATWLGYMEILVQSIFANQYKHGEQGRLKYSSIQRKAYEIFCSAKASENSILDLELLVWRSNLKIVVFGIKYLQY